MASYGTSESLGETLNHHKNSNSIGWSLGMGYFLKLSGGPKCHQGREPWMQPIFTSYGDIILSKLLYSPSPGNIDFLAIKELQTWSSGLFMLRTSVADIFSLEPASLATALSPCPVCTWAGWVP